MSNDQRFVDVAATEEMPIGSQRSVLVELRRILVCRTEQGLFAVDDLCPHALQRLAGSKIENGIIRCSRHGAQFSLATGRPVNGVTNEPLRTYPVRVREGRIEVGA